MQYKGKHFFNGLCRRLRRLSVVALVLYALVCIGCASWQRRLIYYPPHFAVNQVDEYARITKVERWTNAAGKAIGMKRMSPVQPSAGRILVVYGNGSWSVGCAHYADPIQKLAPYDVYILEYPGYADREGTPSQQHLFESADEAIRILGTNQPTYIIGESLGTGVAAYLAGKYPDQINGLMLLSPYDRLTGVAQDHMPFLPVHLLLVDRFPSVDYLRRYHGPVGVMVDGRDTVVPERFGLRLFSGYDGPKRLWRFPDGGHVSIMEPNEVFWNKVLEFWSAHP